MIKTSAPCVRRSSSARACEWFGKKRDCCAGIGEMAWGWGQAETTGHGVPGLLPHLRAGFATTWWPYAVTLRAVSQMQPHLENTGVLGQDRCPWQAREGPVTGVAGDPLPGFAGPTCCYDRGSQ